MIATALRRACLALLAAAAFAVPAAERAPQAWAVIVAGEGGEASFSENYRDWCARLHALLTGPCGVPADHVALLMERKDLLPAITAETSTAEHVVAALAATRAKLDAGDQLVVALIGHGSTSAGVSKLCLPGPDLAADALAAQLADLPTREVVVINAAGGAYGFLSACSLPGRVIVSATNSVGEGNEAYFLEFLLRAYEAAGPEGLDLLAAFDRAATECPKWYSRQYLTATKPAAWEVQGRTARQLWTKFYGAIPEKILAPVANPDAEDAEPVFGEWGEHWKGRRMTTEHAQLDDNGDHTGTSVFVDNRFVPLDGADEAADGWTAKQTRLGHPRGDVRPPPAPLPLPSEPAQ